MSTIFSLVVATVLIATLVITWRILADWTALSAPERWAGGIFNGALWTICLLLIAAARALT